MVLPLTSAAECHRARRTVGLVRQRSAVNWWFRSKEIRTGLLGSHLIHLTTQRPLLDTPWVRNSQGWNGAQLDERVAFENLGTAAFVSSSPNCPFHRMTEQKQCQPGSAREGRHRSSRTLKCTSEKFAASPCLSILRWAVAIDRTFPPVAMRISMNAVHRPPRAVLPYLLVSSPVRLCSRGV